MILGFGNNVVSSIAQDLTASQTTIQVMPGAGSLFSRLLTADFVNNATPMSIYAKITLSDAGAATFEVCHLLSVSGDVLTVIRGQEGTLAKGWSLNDVVANFSTRGSENHFAQIAQIQAGSYTAGTAGGTANALTLELPSTFFTNGSTSWELKAPLIVYPIHNNTGASTLQLTIGGRILGTFHVLKCNREPLDAGDIRKDVGFACLLDSTKSAFTIIGVGVGALPATDYKPRTDSLNNQQGAIADTKNKDMNSCVAGEFGLYEKATCANSPPGAGSNFYCETKSIYAQTALIQIAWTFDGMGVLAWRNYSVNTRAWGTWRESYDTGRKPTPADVGALAKTGDTATGNIIAPKLIMSAAQGTGSGDAIRYDFTESQMPNRYAVIGVSQDLNNYQTPGFYLQSANAGADSGSNYPQVSAGALLVFRHAGICQLYITYAADGSRRIFHRNLYSSTWSAWATIYDTNFKPTAADVGAAPASHTHTPASIGAANTMRPFINGGSMGGFTQCTVSIVRWGRAYPLTFAIPSTTTEFWIANRGGENADRDYDFGVNCERRGSDMIVTPVGRDATISTIHIM